LISMFIFVSTRENTFLIGRTMLLTILLYIATALRLNLSHVPMIRCRPMRRHMECMVYSNATRHQRGDHICFYQFYSHWHMRTLS
jgi:hypothetical protein